MKVLISGASMAGLSAAYWFARMGHQVQVVERSDGLRQGGAPIDVRGRALGTAERMGILGQIEAQKVSILEPSPVLDGQGVQVASLDLRWFANETDQDVEIVSALGVQPSADASSTTGEPSVPVKGGDE